MSYNKRRFQNTVDTTAIVLFGSVLQNKQPELSTDAAAYIGQEIYMRMPKWLREIRFWEEARYSDLIEAGVSATLRYFLRDYAAGEVDTRRESLASVFLEIERVYADHLRFFRTAP